MLAAKFDEPLTDQILFTRVCLRLWHIKNPSLQNSVDKYVSLFALFPLILQGNKDKIGCKSETKGTGRKIFKEEMSLERGYLCVKRI